MIIIVEGISLMMILTACDLVKKDHQWVQEHWKYLEAGSNVIKEVSQNIQPVISDLNSYLNGATSAFEQSDSSAATHIKNNTIAQLKKSSTKSCEKLPG